jgi:hypothetical protein
MRPVAALALAACAIAAAACAGGRDQEPPPVWPHEALPDLPPPAGWTLDAPMRLLRIAGGSVRRAEARLVRDPDAESDGLPAWGDRLGALGWTAAGPGTWIKGDERLVLRRSGAGWTVTLGGAGRPD